MAKGKKEDLMIHSTNNICLFLYVCVGWFFAGREGGWKTIGNGKLNGYNKAFEVTEYSALQIRRQIISNWDLGCAKVGP